MFLRPIGEVRRPFSYVNGQLIGVEMHILKKIARSLIAQEIDFCQKTCNGNRFL